MRKFSTRSILFILALTLLDGILRGEPVTVRYPQGSTHGFLVLKTLDGRRIATGDVTQIVHGNVVTSRVVFYFRDGSVDDETTVFSQRGVFRLLKDHHLQRGPSFPTYLDSTIDALAGDIACRDQAGTVTKTHLDLPSDLANGLPPNLLLNVRPSSVETKLSYVVTGNKPRLIHFTIKTNGKMPFSIAGTPREAVDFVLHVELGGVTGLIAPILGKQPADYHIWILDGTPPAFIREEGQLYEGGPVWRVEQASPSFNR